MRVLDAGAKGVVVPHICTAAQAELAVKSSRYFPEGMRSLNGGRPAGFGKLDLPTYIQQANQEVMVIAMIEDREGVENLDVILSVPGLDMVLEGAADLSQSYGVPWQTSSEQVREAMFKFIINLYNPTLLFVRFQELLATFKNGLTKECKRLFWETIAVLLIEQCEISCNPNCNQ